MDYLILGAVFTLIYVFLRRVIENTTFKPPRLRKRNTVSSGKRFVDQPDNYVHPEDRDPNAEVCDGYKIESRKQDSRSLLPLDQVKAQYL